MKTNKMVIKKITAMILTAVIAVSPFSSVTYAAESDAAPAKSSYNVTIVLDGVKTASGDTTITAAQATVSAKGSKTFTATTMNGWVKTKSVHVDGATYKYENALRDAAGNTYTSIKINGADLKDDTTFVYTPVYSSVADMKVTVNFNNIIKSNGEVTSDTESNTLTSGSGWSFTQKKLDNKVTSKSFSLKGAKYEYTGKWINEEDGSEFTSLSIKNDGSASEKVYNIRPVYEITKAQVLSFHYIDNISTGSGSWQNEDEFSSFTHTFKQPEAQKHYEFVEWKNLENGNKYNEGDKFTFSKSDFEPGVEMTTINIHAMWQPSVTVEYYDGEELLKSVETTKGSIEAYGYDAADADEVQSGAEFIGWYESDDEDAARVEEGTVYDLPEVTSAPVDRKVIKLYARYAADYNTEYYLEDLNGEYELAADETEVVEGAIVGTRAAAEIKDFEGFTFDSEIPGTLTEADVRAGLTLKVYYSRNAYEVSYEYEGDVIPANAESQLPETMTYKYGQKVPSGKQPTASGYKFNGWMGEVEDMPANDVVVTGSWDEIEKAPAVDPEGIINDITNNDNNGGNNNANANRNDNTDTNAVALANGTDADEIADSDAPMAIADNGTPMAAGNGQTSAWALINLICAILTAILSLILVAGLLRRKDDEDDEEEKRRPAARLFSIVLAVAAVVAFILTEDMNDPMVMTDNWTILMAVILVLQAVTAIIAKRRKEEDDSYEAA